MCEAIQCRILPDFFYLFFLSSFIVILLTSNWHGSYQVIPNHSTYFSQSKKSTFFTLRFHHQLYLIKLCDGNCTGLRSSLNKLPSKSKHVWVYQRGFYISRWSKLHVPPYMFIQNLCQMILPQSWRGLGDHINRVWQKRILPEIQANSKLIPLAYSPQS